jgi:predicted transcriptional regulator of viral defense system
MNNFKEILLEEFGEDEPILINEMVNAFPDVSRVTVFNWLNKALDEGFMERYSRGVYYIPRDGILGKVKLLSLKVIRKKYLSDESFTYGYVSGLNLENEIGVSPQVPATLEVTTNNASKRVREIEPFGGYKEVVLRTPRTEVTNENVDALRFLDIITRTKLSTLTKFEQNNLREFYKTINKKTIYECAKRYPAKTSKRLLEYEANGVLAS